MRKIRQLFYVYIAYQPEKKRYFIGATRSIKRRIDLLRQLHSKNIRLVYYEEYDDSAEADRREDELLEMQKESLKELITQTNPLHTDILTFK